MEGVSQGALGTLYSDVIAGSDVDSDACRDDDLRLVLQGQGGNQGSTCHLPHRVVRQYYADRVRAVVIDQIGHMADAPVFINGETGILIPLREGSRFICVIEGVPAVFFDQCGTVKGYMDGSGGSDSSAVLSACAEGHVQRISVQSVRAGCVVNIAGICAVGKRKSLYGAISGSLIGIEALCFRMIRLEILTAAIGVQRVIRG